MLLTRAIFGKNVDEKKYVGVEKPKLILFFLKEKGEWGA